MIKKYLSRQNPLFDQIICTLISYYNIKLSYVRKSAIYLFMYYTSIDVGTSTKFLDRLPK